MRTVASLMPASVSPSITKPWTDASSDSPSGELTALIRIDDPEWGADPSAIADPVSEDYLVERAVALVPGTQTRVVGGEIEVFRRPRTEFTTSVTGRLVWLAGADEEERPVQGVEVRLSYFLRTDADPSPIEPHRVFVDGTDAGGNYEFTISWSDLAPGDYDFADERSDALPSTEPGATDGIAAGEDGLRVLIAYDDLAVPGGVLVFSSEDGEYEISSNPRGGTNRLPDVFKVPTP